MATPPTHLWLSCHALLKKESQRGLYHFLAQCRISERSPVNIIFYVLFPLSGCILHITTCVSSWPGSKCYPKQTLVYHLFVCSLGATNGLNIFKWIKNNQRQYNILWHVKITWYEMSLSLKSFIRTQPCLIDYILSRAAFLLQWQTWVFAIEIVGLTKSKIFITWCFTEK